MAPEICGAGMVWLGKVAEHVVMVPARLPSTSKAMDQTLRMRVVASEILRWMNDNPNNLFVDDGGENSGIGSFTHDMEAILGSLENLNWSQNSFNDIKGDVLEEIGKRSGSWGRVAKEHYASIKPTAIALVKDAECPEDLVSVVEDLAFSTDFDLDKADASKDKNMLLWKVREGFLAFAKEENKNLLEFGELIVEFVENGWS